MGYIYIWVTHGLHGVCHSGCISRDHAAFGPHFVLESYVARMCSLRGLACI